MKDLADMPNWNPGTGTHGLHSVTGGRVGPDRWGKPWCARHGAMNAVNQDRTIWRCITAVADRADGKVVSLCGEGAYMERFE